MDYEPENESEVYTNYDYYPVSGLSNKYYAIPNFLAV